MYLNIVNKSALSLSLSLPPSPPTVVPWTVGQGQRLQWLTVPSLLLTSHALMVHSKFSESNFEKKKTSILKWACLTPPIIKTHLLQVKVKTFTEGLLTGEIPSDQ